QTKKEDYNVRQSNLYIVLYAAAITIVCGGALAIASQTLKPLQDANIELERKKNILATVMELKEGDDVVKLYASRVKESVIDFQGNVKTGMKASQVIIAEQYKLKPEERLLPIYEFRNQTDTTKIENAVMPVYGYGLWNNIWGFVALQADLNTVQGVKFEHAGETPGLGARITSDDIQVRYKGKKVFEGDKIMSVQMQKGEGMDYSADPHKVDGMSGATLTGKGVNNMLADYFSCYKNYLKKNQQNLSLNL
ncbi:MAG: NADH:ubiquinone reductase (Na(+)-transporting) subunit C, partial [Cytophagales bacterium]|nr:NADH:ubiquinone reductase (Na(+)-transporting) subunit C [Cytophagales bacterium]